MSLVYELEERLKRAHDRLHDVIRDRDELLEALTGLMKAIENADYEAELSPLIDGSLLDAANVAIAKATTPAAKRESV